MDTSILIAQIVAIIYLSLGIGLLINPDYYHKAFQDFLENASHIFQGGVIAIVLGMLIVTNHNYWGMEWQVLITLIGWGALVKGSLLLIVPELAAGLDDMVTPTLRNAIITPLVIIFGILFTYFGFFA